MKPYIVEINPVQLIAENIGRPDELPAFLETLDVDYFQDWDYTLKGLSYYLSCIDTPNKIAEIAGDEELEEILQTIKTIYEFTK